MINLLFLIILIIFELKRNKTNGMFDLLTGINGFYGLYFGLSPFLLTFFDLREFFPIWGVPVQIQVFYSYKDTASVINSNLFVFISYVSIVYGYYLFKRKKNVKIPMKDNTQVSSSSILYLGIISFILAFFSLSYYTYSLNGISNAIFLAEYYRSINSNIQDSFLFLRIFQPFILSSFYSFLILKNRDFPIKKNKYTPRYLFILIMYIITFLLSIYYLLITGSRAQVLVLIFTVLLFKSKKIRIKNFFLIGIIVFVGYVYGDTMLTFLQTGQYIETDSKFTYIDNIGKFVSQTIFPYINTVVVPSSFVTGFSDYRFFSDYLFVWIINMLPGSLVGLIGVKGINSLWVVNTNHYHSITGGIPVDIISSGYYQFGIIGIILLGFAFGIIVKKLDNILLKYDNDAMRLLKIRFLFFIPAFVINADIEVMIRSGLNIIVMFVVFFTTIRKSS